MLDQGRLNLGGRQAMTRNIDDIVNAAANPIIAFVVAASSVASELSYRLIFKDRKGLYNSRSIPYKR